MPDILLYGYVGSESTQRFIREIDAANGEDITIRVNTQGGSPEDMWGMVAKFKEYEGSKSVKVDGRAFSAGTFFLPYADSVEALDVSQFLIHRAAYSEWFEKSEYMTAAMWENLDNINNSLKAAISSKIDIKKLEALKNIKFKDIWSNETRLDVFLTASEAKQIGLIDKITKITPARRAEIKSYFSGIAAEFIPEEIIPETIIEENNQNQIITMTIEELKTKHPDVYLQAVNAGVEQERDRVGAWMAYADADLKAVSEGIEGGKPLTMKAQAEFGKKLLSKGLQSQVENDSAADSSKSEEPKAGKKEEGEDDKAKALASFEAEVDKQLKG